ncbi:MAG: glycosyltransferase [Bacteroidales bacterium]|nr:glycosyltransferase [Bacteroidales bacterium]
MKFLIYTLTSWDEAPRARHQVTNELLNLGHELYFIEKNRLGLPGISYKTNGNLTLVTPFFIPGYIFRYRIPVINEIYQNWLFKRLKARLGDMCVITFDFTAHRLKSFFSEVVYYCNDEYIGNSKFPNLFVDNYHKICEKSVIKHSLLSITTSPFLTRKLSRYTNRVYEIPLGGPNPASIPLMRSRNKKGKVTVGLVGFITERTISYAVINHLLEDDQMIIRFIGTVENRFLNKISDPSRIELLGVLKGQDLYAAIQQFDVAIIPYELDKINPGATPNKLYQYLACGIPVVMTSMPNLKGKEFPEGTVYKSKNNDDFLTLVKRALEDDNKDYEAVRRRLAHDNSWEKRIGEFMTILKNHKLF